MITFGKSDLLSREIAERVRTAVTPSVILSLVASLSLKCIIITITINIIIITITNITLSLSTVDYDLHEKSGEPVEPEANPAEDYNQCARHINLARMIAR